MPACLCIHVAVVLVELVELVARNALRASHSSQDTDKKHNAEAHQVVHPCLVVHLPAHAQTQKRASASPDARMQRANAPLLRVAKHAVDALQRLKLLDSGLQSGAPVNAGHTSGCCARTSSPGFLSGCRRRHIAWYAFLISPCVAAFVKPSVSYRERAILYVARGQGPWRAKAFGARRCLARSTDGALWAGSGTLRSGGHCCGRRRAAYCERARGTDLRHWPAPSRTRRRRRGLLCARAGSMPSAGALSAPQFTAAAVPARQRHAAARLAGLRFARRAPCAQRVLGFFGADRAPQRLSGGAVHWRSRRRRATVAEAGTGANRFVVVSVFAQPGSDASLQ